MRDEPPESEADRLEALSQTPLQPHRAELRKLADRLRALEQVKYARAHNSPAGALRLDVDEAA